MAGARREAQTAPQRLILDSGAVIALSRGDQRARAYVARAIARRAPANATVDALVVAHAVEAGGAHILTGDREDLERLAASHPEVWIQLL